MLRLRLLMILLLAIPASDASAIDFFRSCPEIERETDSAHAPEEWHRCFDSRKIEFGYQRVQRFDRNGENQQSAYENDVFVYYRSGATSVRPFEYKDCGFSTSPEECDAKLTYDWEGLVSFDPDGASSKRLQARASVYYPIVTDPGSSGIYQPFSERILALGASLQGTQLLDADILDPLGVPVDDIAELHKSVFVKFRCDFASGKCGQWSKDMVFDFEARYSAIDADESFVDRHTTSVLAEAIFPKHDFEHALRFYGLDTYDNTDLDSEQVGAEYAASFCLWRCAPQNAEKDRWHVRFDLAVGYEDFAQKNNDSSGFYARPMLYIRWLPEQSNVEGPYGFGSGWGNWFTWP